MVRRPLPSARTTRTSENPVYETKAIRSPFGDHLGNNGLEGMTVAYSLAMSRTINNVSLT